MTSIGYLDYSQTEELGGMVAEVGASGASIVCGLNAGIKKM